MPWYAALLIAITATAIGYGIDAGQKELTHVFAGFYIAGCVAAVLAVRQEGLFTAMIQPPLILFCAVPGAYWLFHGGKLGHLKDLLINCGYPLIERFPLMLGTAGGVLLIGLARWYYGSRQTTTAAATTSDGASTGARATLTDLVAKLRAILRTDSGLDSGDDDADEARPAEARRRRRSGSASRAHRSARRSRSAADSTSTRSRRSRQLADEGQEPVERPRRSSRRDQAAARDYEPTEAPRRSRRRPRPEADPDVRTQPPRDSGRDPRTRRSPYERPTPRSSRFDGLDRYGDAYGDRYDPPAPSDRFGRYDAYERHEPSYEPRRRTPNGAHHPISQVRYRGAASPDEPRAEPRERRSRSRAQGRSQRRPPAESWEYDL